jgi:hypothetical protein
MSNWGGKTAGMLVPPAARHGTCMPLFMHLCSARSVARVLSESSGARELVVMQNGTVTVAPGISAQSLGSEKC